MELIKRTEIADGVFFNSVKDNRFKTMKITANILIPLSEQTASDYALLCGVLSHSCKDYPDFTSLSKKLSSLYGADIETSVRKAGDNQHLRFSVSGLDDRYALDGDSISQELSSLLCKVIFEPNIVDGGFVSTEIEQERRQLLDVIDSEFNDKRIYANGQLISNMCADEVYGIKRYGTAEKIKAVTAEALVEAWQKLLQSARIEIMYVGDSSSEKARNVFKKYFESNSRRPVLAQTSIVRSAGEVKTICEEMELSQSKLVMGFRTGIAQGDSEVYAARLMSAVLGGTANSKLFCNVREKQSLCYYCSSRFDQLKGILVVDSGVEGENIEKAQQGIFNEIEEMKKGNITDFEMQATKMAVINSIRSSNDTVSGIELWYSGQIFDDKFRTIDELAEKINAVTTQEVIECAQKLTLDTVYVLKNK